MFLFQTLRIKSTREARNENYVITFRDTCFRLCLTLFPSFSLSLSLYSSPLCVSAGCAVQYVRLSPAVRATCAVYMCQGVACCVQCSTRIHRSGSRKYYCTTSETYSLSRRFKKYISKKIHQKKSPSLVNIYFWRGVSLIINLSLSENSIFASHGGFLL